MPRREERADRGQALGVPPKPPGHLLFPETAEIRDETHRSIEKKRVGGREMSVQGEFLG